MAPKATKSKKVVTASKKSLKKSSLPFAENREGNKENQAQNDQHEPIMLQKASRKKLQNLKAVVLPAIEVLPAIVEKQKKVEKSAKEMPQRSNLKKRDERPVTRSMQMKLNAAEGKKKTGITFSRELFSIKPPTPYFGPRRSTRIWTRANFEACLE